MATDIAKFQSDLELAEKSVSSADTPDVSARLVVNCLNQLAKIFTSHGDFPAGQETFHRLLRLIDSLRSMSSMDVEALRMLSAGLIKLGDGFCSAHLFIPAGKCFEDAFSITETVLNQEERSVDDLRRAILATNRIGGVARAYGDFNRTSLFYGKSVEFSERLLALDEDDPTIIYELCQNLRILGQALHRSDNQDDNLTRSFFLKSQHLAEKAIDRFGETPKFLTELSFVLDNLALFESDEPRIGYRQRCIELRKRVIELEGETLNGLGNLFYAYCSLCQSERDPQNSEPLDLARYCFSRIQELFPEDPNVASYQDFLAMIERIFCREDS